MVGKFTKYANKPKVRAVATKRSIGGQSFSNGNFIWFVTKPGRGEISIQALRQETKKFLNTNISKASILNL